MIDIQKMTIADELENREVEICNYCNENPKRENMKTCSKECSEKMYSRNKIEYSKMYRKLPYVIKKRRNYGKEYGKRDYVIVKRIEYQNRPEVKERKRLYDKEHNKRRK